MSVGKDSYITVTLTVQEILTLIETINLARITALSQGQKVPIKYFRALAGKLEDSISQEDAE